MEFQQSETFGNYIQDARIASGLSRGQAAAAIGISKSLLRFWETDHVSSPDLAKLQKLAILLNLDPIKTSQLAGYDPTETLPPMRPYLRSKYPDLPETALKEIADITKKYGIDPNGRGPAPGEDEA